MAISPSSSRVSGLKAGWDLIRMREGEKGDNWADPGKTTRKPLGTGAQQFTGRAFVSVESGPTRDEIAGGEALAQGRNPTGKTAGQLSRLRQAYPHPCRHGRRARERIIIDLLAPAAARCKVALNE